MYVTQVLDCDIYNKKTCMMMYSLKNSRNIILFSSKDLAKIYSVSLYREQKYSENINLGRESAWTFAESGRD